MCKNHGALLFFLWIIIVHLIILPIFATEYLYFIIIFKIKLQSQTAYQSVC